MVDTPDSQEAAFPIPPKLTQISDPSIGNKGVGVSPDKEHPDLHIKFYNLYVGEGYEERIPFV